MFRNRRSVWNVRAIPRRRDLVRLQADDALAVERDVALVRPVDAGDQVEERRLAGAVRPDHADDLALVDVQVEVRRRPSGRRTPATRLVELEQRHRVRVTRSPRAARRAGRSAGRSSARSGSRRARCSASASGFGEHHVLPDERREVERRHEQRRAAPSRAASVSGEHRRRSAADVRRPARPSCVEPARAATTQCDERRRAKPPCCSPVAHDGVDRAETIACTTKPKAIVATTTIASCLREAGTAVITAADHERGRRARATGRGSRSSSSSTFTMIAPSTTPAWLPEPPRITIV